MAMLYFCPIVDLTPEIIAFEVHHSMKDQVLARLQLFDYLYFDLRVVSKQMHHKIPN